MYRTAIFLYQLLTSDGITRCSGSVVIFCLLCHYISGVFLLLDMERRDLSHKEKLYLREQNVITETQCTLGRKDPYARTYSQNCLQGTLFM